jgi:hypothetical protein
MANEGIIDKQEKLFKECEEKPLHKDTVFIRDGIIDIERWQKTDKKIVFLLNRMNNRTRRIQIFIAKTYRSSYTIPLTSHDIGSLCFYKHIISSGFRIIRTMSRLASFNKTYMPIYKIK